MAFPRGQTRTATGGATGGGGSGGGGRRGIGGGPASGAAADYEPIPKERRARTLRRIVAFFEPYWVQVAHRPRGDPGDEPHRAHQPAPARPAHRPGHRRWQLPEPEPVRRADDRAADHHRAHRRRPELPQQRHRPERHAGPARRPVRPPAEHAAPLLHRDAHRRDPEPAGQRHRWRPGGRDRHGQLDHEQPGDRDQHDRRDVPARLAARAPVARPDAVLPVPHLPRRQGPARGLDRDPEVAGRADRHDRGDAQRVGHPAVEDVRPAGQLDRQVPWPQQARSPRSRSARRWSVAGSS